MIDINHYFYDRLLMSGKDTIDASIFYNYANTAVVDDSEGIKVAKRDKRDELAAISVLRYAFRYYLAWPPEYAIDHISEDLLRKLKLYDVAKKRINFPQELAAPNAPWLYYLICKIYPETYTYDPTSAIEAFYDIFLTTSQRSKTFFDSSIEGRNRANVCLRYALRKEGIISAADAYAKFTAAKIKPWLTKYKLLTYCTDSYVRPIEFLYDALPHTRENEREFRLAYLQAIEIEKMKKLRKVKKALPKEDPKDDLSKLQ